MLNFAFFVFGICRQENRQLFVVVLQSFLTTMCRKVQPSIFISKRKRLINWKCYTKDSFSFTSLFISLKSALFPLLSCSHSTLRNTTCTLYQSAHPQIRLQPNIASRSFLKTNILLLPPPPPLAAWKTLQKRPGYFADTWQPAQKRCAFPEEKLQKAEVCLTLGHPWKTGPLASHEATLGAGSAVAGDPRPLSSPLLSTHEQQGVGKDSASQCILMPQPVVVSAGSGRGRHSWQPPGCG